MKNVNKLIKLSLLLLIVFYESKSQYFDQDVEEFEITGQDSKNIFRKGGCCRSSCCGSSSSANYRSVTTQNLTVSNNASVIGNLNIGGTLTVNSINVPGSFTVNQKSPVLGGLESLIDYRFTIMMPSEIGLTLTASATAPYIITAALSGVPVPIRSRGFGTVSPIGTLKIANPAINLSTAQFSLLYSDPDAGSVVVAGAAPTQAISTASAIVINLAFDIMFPVTFSSFSSFSLPTVAMALENLGTPVFANAPGAFISNITPYLTSLTNAGFTVNLAITVIGQEVTVPANVDAMATAVSNFIQGAYIDFIIQGS